MNSKIIPVMLISFGLLCLLAGCSAESGPSNADTPAHPILDTLNIALPDGIRELDNLTVYPVENPPKSHITLEEEVRFGDTDEVLLGHIEPRNILIDDRGRIFLGDGGWGHRGIHVYAPDGSFIKTMGGGGKGPGEFLDATNMGLIGNKLYLFDRDLDRVNVYSLEGLEISHTHVLDPRKWDHIEEIQSSTLLHLYFRSDSTYLAGFVEQVNPELSEDDRLIRYYQTNQEGEIISGKILEQRSLKFLRTQTSRFTLEHNRQSLLSLTDSDGMIGAWTEDFLLKLYDSNGQYQSAIYYPFEREAINKQAVLTRHDETAAPNMSEQLNLYKARINDATLPEQWPALNSMLVDDEGRIWVATVDNYLDTFTWWVLEDSGELLARFTRPQNERIAAVKDGYAYVLVEEGGGEEIVKYRVTLASDTATTEEVR